MTSSDASAPVVKTEVVMSSWMKAQDFVLRMIHEALGP
jgi:hypothetical protein